MWLGGKGEANEILKIIFTFFLYNENKVAAIITQLSPSPKKQFSGPF
jgi:hypothetical protein